MIRHWIVLRHAHAEAQSADGQDFSRELSERGREEARRAAAEEARNAPAEEAAAE